MIFAGQWIQGPPRGSLIFFHLSLSLIFPCDVVRRFDVFDVFDVTRRRHPRREISAPSIFFEFNFSNFFLNLPATRETTRPVEFPFLSGTIMTFWLSLLLPMLDSEFVSNFFPSYRNTETRPTAWQNDHTNNKSSIWVPSSRGKQIKLLERTLGADSDQSGETQHKLPVLIYQLLNLTCQLELWWCLLSDKETWISSWDTTHNAS